MFELFADGGVVHKNPSPYGGTWAYRMVIDGNVLCEQSGVIDLKSMRFGPEGAPHRLNGELRLNPVTNNQTEMLAVVMGLQVLPETWTGTIYTDSKVTIDRIWNGSPWSNIPLWLFEAFGRERKRLIFWDEIQHILLDGHPTVQHLKQGFGKRGHPVSAHQVWCDKACGSQARMFLQSIKKESAVKA